MMGFDRSTLGDLDSALTHEWLETNGIGGFASSTIVGLNTRRYHGLLVAALKPRVRPHCLAAEPEHRSPLEPGDRVLFYTDGVTEVFDATGAELGEDGLAGFMLDAMTVEVSGMIDRILERVAAFQHGPVTDDRTLILFAVR